MVDDVMEGVDVLDPPKKIVYIEGEALDFTFVPTRLTLKGLRIVNDIQAGKLSEVDGLDKMIELIAEQCSRTNPKITADWILDNTSIDTIQKMGQDLAGVQEGQGTKEGEPAKN